MRTIKQIARWANAHGINVERHSRTRIDVFCSGSVVCSCENIQETIDAVWEFINGHHT